MQSRCRLPACSTKLLEAEALELPRHVLLVGLKRAAADLKELRVAPQPLHGVLSHVPVATEHLPHAYVSQALARAFQYVGLCMDGAGRHAQCHVDARTCIARSATFLPIVVQNNLTPSVSSRLPATPTARTHR